MIESVKLATPIDVYLKLNSGMNRLGFPLGEARRALERLRGSGNVGAVTLMTHFADADGERGVDEQARAFAAVAGELALPTSNANSAALLRYAHTHGEWVRPGIMLYGCSPFPEESAQAIGVRPVMTLRSRVIAVQSVAPGARVGYSGTFVAPRDRKSTRLNSSH